MVQMKAGSDFDCWILRVGTGIGLEAGRWSGEGMSEEDILGRDPNGGRRGGSRELARRRWEALDFLSK